MKRIGSFLYLFSCIFFLISCAQKEKQIPRDIASLQAMGGMEGIWFLQGTSSTRGPYNGELELRKSYDGTYDVVRIVTYINYFYDGLKVQEVWTGKALAHDSSLVVSYDLRQADFISKLGSAKRKSNEFNNSIAVIARFIGSPVGLSTRYGDEKISNYTEWITTKRSLEPQPIWINERQSIDGRGLKPSLVIKNAIRSFKTNIGFDKDPTVKFYRDRKEYKQETPYFIFDPTDFNFYRSNKDIIRVVNKITDDISIAESVVKRNSYAPTLSQKAKGYDFNTKNFHLNSAGVISRAVMDEGGKLLSYAADEETALWTGMYLGSQAMRFITTANPEALENVKRSLNGILTVFEQKSESSLKGIAHGLLWASLVIPKSDIGSWTALRRAAKEFFNLSVVMSSPQNQRTALGLVAWISGEKSFRDQYEQAFQGIKRETIEGGFDGPFYWQGVADWSDANLRMVGLITDIILADILSAHRVRDQLREKMLDSWVIYEPAQRHLLTLATYGFAYRHGTRSEKFRTQSSEDRFTRALSRSIWALREIPYPRPALDVTIDYSLKPEWCLSPTPRSFWITQAQHAQAADLFFQGLFSYPAFELSAFSSSFLWQESAFQFQARNQKGIENSGVDYLYAYWLAQYAGVRNDD